MKKYLTSLLLLLPLLLLSLCWPKSGHAEKIMRAVPERWKKKKVLIAAIAAHETGNFKSNAFLKCNNAFGIKTKTQTQCSAPVSEGAPFFYRSYPSVWESVRDFVQWLERRNITPEMQDSVILEMMGKYGYYQDVNYSKKVLKWKSALQ